MVSGATKVPTSEDFPGKSASELEA
jgi:hypothetical protein